MTKDLQVVAYPSKEKEIPHHENILGIDVNAKHFAVSVVSPKGEILYQIYLGRYIWTKRVRFMERRAKLQSLDAEKKLVLLKHKERDFVKTNLGQVVREIIRIASRFNADVAIEKLRKI